MGAGSALSADRCLPLLWRWVIGRVRQGSLRLMGAGAGLVGRLLLASVVALGYWQGAARQFAPDGYRTGLVGRPLLAFVVAWGLWLRLIIGSLPEVFF